MVTRGDIVDEARSWVGTPFRHQAQLKGKGCDCKGLVCGVADALDLPEARCLAALIRNYSTGFDGRALFNGLVESLIRVRGGEAQPGDVLAILMGRDAMPRHLAIVSDDPGFIFHAYGGGVREVAEVPIGRLRVHSRWTWPSLGGLNG